MILSVIELIENRQKPELTFPLLEIFMNSAGKKPAQLTAMSAVQAFLHAQ